MKENQDYLLQRIEALVRENERLNNELRKIKDCAFKIRITDPNFDKPLSQIEMVYDLITFEKI